MVDTAFAAASASIPGSVLVLYRENLLLFTFLTLFYYIYEHVRLARRLTRVKTARAKLQKRIGAMLEDR